MKLKTVEEIIEIPNNVELTVDEGTIACKGPKGEVSRKLVHPKVKISVNGKKINFLVKDFSKKEKTILGTFKSHIRGLIEGTINGYKYDLKICSGHFPMNVSVSGNEVIIKNFLGEKIPRKAKIMEGVRVDINGDKIEVFGLSKEKTGQTAANIENSTRITNRDRRVFQDGIYITSKANKKVK